ncbi:MAG: ShlB/FhaC/HecB family hemolysin secretion/activation protein [Nitrospirota bacterium]|nr:ShlB/FhaC/HecB family hemolysin secretion/activation protein [Nitrospirota bacterium]
MPSTITKIKVIFSLLMILLLLPGLLYAEEKKILVEKFIFTGNAAISSAELKLLVKGYEGKQLSFSEIQKVAELVTAEYARRNFTLARAYLPQQDIANKQVEIAIVEGKVGTVRIQGDHKYYSDAFIRKHFEPLLSKSAYDQASLEKALLVLNDYLKLNVSATLQAGAMPGTTDLVVTANNSFPWNLTLDYNNHGSSYTSRSRFGLSLELGNLIKEGSLLSLRGVSGENPSDLLHGRISYSLPLNVSGTKLGLYYSRGSFDVAKDLAVLNIENRTESYGIFLTHPIIKQRTKKLTAEIDFDAKNTRQEILGTLFSRDKIRSLRAGLSFENTDSSGRNFASLFITQGLGHTLGAMAGDDPLASRAGADNSFTKLNLDMLRVQRIASPVYLFLKGSAQWASTSVVAGEQFTVGGAETVRGYPQGEASGDSGYAATAELRVSPLSNKEILQLALFVDRGTAYVKNAVAGQKKHQSLTGGGVGVRLNLPYNFDIKADVAFPLSPSQSSDNKDAVLYLQAVKRF